MMEKTAAAIMEGELEKAVKIRRADQRARYLVDMAIVYAMTEAREPDEGNYRQFAHDVALDATACLIRHFYEDDAELAAIRAERDEFRSRLESLLRVMPTRIAVENIVGLSNLEGKNP